MILYEQYLDNIKGFNEDKSKTLQVVEVKTCKLNELYTSSLNINSYHIELLHKLPVTSLMQF